MTSNIKDKDLVIWDASASGYPEGTDQLKEHDPTDGHGVQLLGLSSFDGGQGPWGYMTETRQAGLLIYSVDTYIHKVSRSGVDLGHFNASNAAYAGSGFNEIINISSDSSGRVYLFGLGVVSGVPGIGVAIFNSDGSNNAGTTFITVSDWTGLEDIRAGIDISPNGQYVYASIQISVPTITSMRDLLRFDITAGNTRTTFASVGPGFSPSGGSGGNYGYIYWGGLAVNPTNGKVAVGVLQRSNDGNDPFGDPITGFNHYIYVYLSTGVLDSSHLVATGRKVFDSLGGFTFNTGPYVYGKDSQSYYPMAFNRTGTDLYFWVLYEDTDETSLVTDHKIKDTFFDTARSAPPLWIYDVLAAKLRLPVSTVVGAN